MRVFLLLLALALIQPPPTFTATWQSPGVARIVWSGRADLTCLYRQTTLIRCWQGLDAGPHVLVLGGRGPLDAAARPSAGDVFTLVQDNRETRAPLRWVLRLPLVTQNASRVRLTFLPWVWAGYSSLTISSRQLTGAGT